jgi:6-phosphogluconate dehydrogenase
LKGLVYKEFEMTYEGIDKKRGEFFHTNWTGEGGDITAGSCDA